MRSTAHEPRHLAATLVLVAAMMSIITSLGAPLITTVATSYHVPLSSAEWMLTITLLTGALATPIMGRLADGRGQHAVITGSLGIVVVGLIIAALSTNFVTLIVGRSLQGVGLGLVPVCMAIARTHLPPTQATRTIATLSVTVAIGVGFGYPLTSCIAEFISFHASFWVAAVFVALTASLAVRILPRNEHAKTVRFDSVGAVGLTLGLTLLLVVLGEGQAWGWRSLTTISTTTASLLILSWWVWFERRCDAPLVDLRQVRIRAVFAVDLVGFLISGAFYLFLPILVEFVTIRPSQGYGFGASVLTSGLLLVPLSIGTFSANRFVPALGHRVHPRAVLPLGCFCFVSSALGFVFFHAHLYEAFIASGVAGIGAGITFAAMPGHIIRSVPASETGAALGFYQLVRNIGLSIGSAVSGVIIAHYTPLHQRVPTSTGFIANLIGAGGLLVLAGVLAFVLVPVATPAHSTVAVTSH